MNNKWIIDPLLRWLNTPSEHVWAHDLFAAHGGMLERLAAGAMLIMVLMMILALGSSPPPKAP